MKQSVHGRKVEGDMGRYLASLYSGQHPDKKYTYTDSYKNDLTLLSHFSTESNPSQKQIHKTAGSLRFRCGNEK